MRYHLIHLGCQMNQSDAERIRTVLEGMGYVSVEDEQTADLLGIVACSVRQKAVDKLYSRIELWNRWKSKRPLLTFASGCILPADREKLMKRFDLLFTIQELPKLPELIRQYGVVTPASAGYDPSDGYWKIAPSYSSSFEAFVPIQNGCDKFCTFCAVPYTRGREVSRPSADILAEVESLVERDYRLITLLGQNVNSYGLDKPEQEIGFPELLRRVGEIGIQSGRRFWVYFTSPHPRDMRDEVIDTIARYPVLANQIHLPIQSGDDKVLIRMNRNYRTDQYRRVVRKIRGSLPTATLFTDIIVGFSGETEEQFENTRAAMREFDYNMAYIAMYSPRVGAASARWADDVPQAEKRRRLQELSKELATSSLAYNRRLIGTRLSVLVDGRDRLAGWLRGRSEGKLIVRFASDDEGLIGNFVDLRISSAAPLSLEGELEQLPAAAAS